MDEVKSSASSNMREEGLSAIKKWPHEIDLIGCNNDLKFIKLVDGHELGTGEDINGKVGFVFVDPLYNVQMDWDADNLECHVLTSEKMRNMAQMIGDVIKPGVYGHLFCTLLQQNL